MSSHFPPKSPQSKLVIRTTVLAAIQKLAQAKSLSSAEQQAILDGLTELGDIQAVQDILVKELSRASERADMDTIGEMLSRIGRLEDIQESLWRLIEAPEANDLLKDTANLVLRHLGDRSEPEKYMHFLDNPEQLIHEEMARTLDLSMSEPQALVDFIDFIVSLKGDSQQQLLDTLKQDFNPHARTQLYQAILESLPNKTLATMAVQALGETGTAQAAKVLARMLQWPEDALPGPRRHFETALKKLQLAGVYHPERGVNPQAPEAPAHILTTTSRPHQCFATISDGLGNQGLLLSRKQEDGQYCLLGVAVHDHHGVVDCFGFQDLSGRDVQRFVERFYESGLKTPVPENYLAFKIKQAEANTLSHFQRLPYEFRAWSVLINDIQAEEPDIESLLPKWVDANWQNTTGHLYQHPEFRHWFTEYGDLMFTGDLFKQLDPVLSGSAPIEQQLDTLEALANELAKTLQGHENWVQAHHKRLCEAAWLLEQQHVDTFRNLAATAAYGLQNSSPDTPSAFTLAYSRKSILEGVLRAYKALNPIPDNLETLLQELKGRFGV